MIVVTGDGRREGKDCTKLWVIALRAGGSTYSRKCLYSNFIWMGRRDRVFPGNSHLYSFFVKLFVPLLLNSVVDE